MDLAKVPVGRAPPNDINVVVEIPQGGDPVKYELDKDSGALFVDRFLHTAMFYPGNYGFVPHTLALDGDPIDVLIVGPASIVPGAVVRCRPVGALIMEDEQGPDEKILAVPVDALHRSTAPSARIGTCRRSCALRSPTSSATTRIWKRASGSRSCAGRTPGRPPS